jgi:acyl carrier protein
MPDAKLVAEVAEVVRSAAKLRPEVLIGPETRLVEDLGIDSLDLVGVLLQVQDRFEMAVDDEDVPSLARVADVAAYIARRRSQVAA